MDKNYKSILTTSDGLVVHKYLADPTEEESIQYDKETMEHVHTGGNVKLIIIDISKAEGLGDANLNVMLRVAKYDSAKLPVPKFLLLPNDTFLTHLFEKNLNLLKTVFKEADIPRVFTLKENMKKEATQILGVLSQESEDYFNN